MGDEGYRVIRGKLTLHATDARGNERQREDWEFKLFQTCATRRTESRC